MNKPLFILFTLLLLVLAATKEAKPHGVVAITPKVQDVTNQKSPEARVAIAPRSETSDVNNSNFNYNKFKG